MLIPGHVRAQTFSDGTFANGDWIATVTAQTGSASHSVLGQQASGGNPGQYRRMTHTLGASSLIRVFHEYQGGSFDPATLAPGETLVLDYAEDRIEFNPPFAGAAIGAAPAIEQDGVVYAGPEINFTNTTWAPRTLLGLTASEFTPIGGSGHPNFTSTGGVITFGYYRFNSSTSGGFTTTHGIDNWSFTVSVAQVGSVLAEQKISDTVGGFLGNIANSDDFGECVAYLGDVDGDGIGDLATTTRDDASASDAGAIWILFLNADDTVKGFEKIAYDGVGGFVGVTHVAASNGANDRFGHCGVGLGDLNYDGVPDLAVGTKQAGDAAVWILFLNADGSVRAERRIGNGEGGFPAGVSTVSQGFGRDVARLGDVDGDGVVDLAVGAPGHDDGGADRGAVFVLFLEPDGFVKGYSKISHLTVPALGLAVGDQIGLGVTGLGDVDGDGVPDLAAGAWRDDSAGVDAGAVYVMLLNADGTVKSHQKLGSAAVGGGLEAADRFGIGVAGLGDVDGDDVPDLAVGATRDDDGGTDRGAVYVVFLNADGSAKGFQKISATAGNFTDVLEIGDEFGVSVEGYTGADGRVRLVVGAMQDDDGGSNRGALYVLRLVGQIKAAVCGNFMREGSEACDDGNKASGDTCTASCRVENVAWLSGTASGGNVSVAVSGVGVSVPTSAGHSAESVLSALAAAMEADVVLQLLGVSSTSAGQVLYTTGNLIATQSNDAGLTFGFRDDLLLEGSQIAFGFPLTFVGANTAVDQSIASLGVSVSGVGGFALPGSVFTGTLAALGPLACQSGVGAPLTETLPGALGGHDLTILGPPGLRCTGGVSGVKTGAIVLHPNLGGFIVPMNWNLGPIGVGGTAMAGYGALAGLPWTEGTARVEGPFRTGTVDQGPYLPPQYLFALEQSTRRGVEARRADGVGVFNPVAPVAFSTRITSGQLNLYSQGDVDFAYLRLRFVPEPSVVVGIGVGLALITWLGLRRSRG